MKQNGFEKLQQFLERHEKIILSTHESPDWDGLGAQIALRNLLICLGKEVIILNSDPINESQKIIDPENIIFRFSEALNLPFPIEESGHIVLDTNVYSNIGPACAALETKVREVFIIDHHEGDENILLANLIEIGASSACELIFQVYEYFEETPDYDSARALFFGMVFDTGSFRYPKTTQETFRIASRLTAAGVKPHEIYEHIYENNSLASINLQNMILSTMEVLADNKLVMMKLTPDLLAATGALYNEGEMAINVPLTIAGVAASVLIKQNIDSTIVKVSLRSRGNIDVASIAKKNGGGGHKNAAGFKSLESFDATYEAVKKEILEAVSRAE